MYDISIVSQQLDWPLLRPAFSQTMSLAKKKLMIAQEKMKVKVKILCFLKTNFQSINFCSLQRLNLITKDQLRE